MATPLERSPSNSKGKAGGGLQADGMERGELRWGLGVVMGFSGFREMMWVMRVSNFCWVFASQACNSERVCSRDAIHSASIASKGSPGELFSKNA